jgi:predicted Zn finger-like uncharacterized protein
MPLPVTCPACHANLKVPDAFAGRKVKCPKCAQQMIVETAPLTADVVADETDDERDDEPARRTKKKRKKKRRRKPNNAWIWLIGVGGSVVMLGLLAFVMVLAGASMWFYGVVLAISLPVSMVILLISIYISNALGIGLDFGDAKIAIPKMIIILIGVNLVSLIPGVGFWLSLLIWIIGFMGLFELDVWEARFLFAINLILSILFRFLVLAAIMHAMQSGAKLPDIMDEPDEEEDRFKTPWDQGGIEDFGGKSGVELPRNVFFIRLSGTGFRDGDFPRLAKFYERVEELNLSHCDVSDKGLKYIKNFTKLKTLILNGTRVTEKGVKELQKKMPDLKIVWSADKTPKDDIPDKDD